MKNMDKGKEERFVLSDMRMKPYFTDKRSIVEISKIIDFCEKLVIKDQEKADIEENLECSSRAYELTRAVLRADTLKNYVISKSDIKAINPVKETIESLTEKETDRLLEWKRFQVYTDYMRKGEYNSYYKKIYDSYIVDNEEVISNLDDFIKNTNLPFFVAARQYQNFSILYYREGILSSVEVAKFKECYSYCLNYFMKVCYNEAYKIDNPNYDNLCKLVIIFMTIERFLNSRMENMDDIDFFDEYSIRNLFLSYGLDYFFDFPLKYQKRILKNINYLIKNKGTNKAIINVLDIFGFDNIKVMKYFLCKEYEKDSAGNIIIDKPYLSFYGIDSEIENIEEALRDKNTMKYDYEEFTKDDKYWYISSKNSDDNDHYEEYLQLLNDSFNFVYTKYISIESFMNLTKFGIDFSNFANLLYHIEEKYNNEDGLGSNRLYFYNYNISPKRIKLLDAVLCLYSLTMKKYHYVDNIVKTPSAIARVYGFNYNDLLDDVYHFTSKYLLTNTARLYDILDGQSKNIVNSQYRTYLTNNELTEADCNFDDYLIREFDKDVNIKCNFYNILPKFTKNLKDENGNEIIDSQESINIRYKAYKDDVDSKNENLPDGEKIIALSLDEYIKSDESSIIDEITNNGENTISEYIMKILLLDNEKEFEKFLKCYNLDRNTVLVNYYIQQYIQLNLTKNEFIKIKEEQPELFESISNQKYINTILDSYIEFKEYNYFTKKDFDIVIKRYLFNSYINVSNIDLYTSRFLEGEISTSVFDNFSVQFELSDEYTKLAEDFLSNKITLNDFKNSIPKDISYRGILANYYATLYLNSAREEKKMLEFKDRYRIDKPIINTMCNDFFNGYISEKDFRNNLQERNLLFADVYFKYLTYKFLNDEYSENSESNTEIYFNYINKYDFYESMLFDEIEYYRNWNKDGLLSKSKLQEYLEKYDTTPTFDFYTLRGIDRPDTIKYLINSALQRHKEEQYFKPINRDKNMTQDVFVEIFKTNNSFRKKLEEAIVETKNYRTFRYYQALHYCCCTSNYRYELFGDHKTFRDYLNASDSNLALYIDKLDNTITDTPADRELLFNEYILELCNSIESYLDDEEFNFIIQGNAILNEYIKGLIYQLVDFIKSYTIQLRDLKTILLFDDKFHNTFFLLEEIAFRNQDSIADLESLLDELQTLNNHGFINVIPTLQDLLAIRNVLRIRNKDLTSIKDIIEKFLTTDYRSELYTILDKQQSNVDIGHVSILNELLDILNVEHELTLEDINTIRYRLEEILSNSNKRSELLAIGERFNMNNSNGFVDETRLRDTLNAIITINDGLDTEIYVTL